MTSRVFLIMLCDEINTAFWINIRQLVMYEWICKSDLLLSYMQAYFNTLMTQQVLEEPCWSERMTPQDLAVLNPLITQHINPCGRFELDMEARLPLAV